MIIPLTHWLYNQPIAHRGLWNENIPENSIPAYDNATKNGFAIETDVFSSTDGVLFCFHDCELSRMTNVNGKIYQKSSDYIKSLTLNGSKEKIPTLEELLDTVNGKVPLLIEIKNQPQKNVVELLLNRLRNYKGEVAIQSFNPIYLLKVKKLAPNTLRGVLGTSLPNGNNALENFIIKHMPFNFLVKPHFISYDVNCLPVKKRKNTPLIAWTVTKSQLPLAKRYADNYIFENFAPEKNDLCKN